jgi:cardiolipin synthase
MHRKLASIDAAVAFVGGINIIDDFDTPDVSLPRYDYAARIEGPLALRVRAEAARLWSRVAWAALGRRWPGFALSARRSARASPESAQASGGGQSGALVVRDSLRHRRDIENAYLEAISSARAEVIVANAYFFPSRKFRRALFVAARRGVAVTLLLQG